MVTLGNERKQFNFKKFPLKNTITRQWNPRWREKVAFHDGEIMTEGDVQSHTRFKLDLYRFIPRVFTILMTV